MSRRRCCCVTKKCRVCLNDIYPDALIVTLANTPSTSDFCTSFDGEWYIPRITDCYDPSPVSSIRIYRVDYWASFITPYPPYISCGATVGPSIGIRLEIRVSVPEKRQIYGFIDGQRNISLDAVGSLNRSEFLISENISTPFDCPSFNSFNVPQLSWNGCFDNCDWSLTTFKITSS